MKEQKISRATFAEILDCIHVTYCVQRHANQTANYGENRK